MASRRNPRPVPPNPQTIAGLQAQAQNTAPRPASTAPLRGETVGHPVETVIEGMKGLAQHGQGLGFRGDGSLATDTMKKE